MIKAVGHIAHVNLGVLVDDLETPAVSEFVDNIERVNAAADRSPGFIARPAVDAEELWALFGETLNGTTPQRLICTLSIWESGAALDQFVHKTLHGRFLDRRAEWFVAQEVASYVIWPIAAGHLPQLEEAKEKLLELRRSGASENAYDFAFLRAAGEAA